MEPWQYLPNPWRQAIAQLPAAIHDSLEEIRFRLGRPVYLYGPNASHALTGPEIPSTVDSNEIERVLAILIDYSVYSRVDELRQGFVTLPGGHRVGVAGRAVWSSARVMTVRAVNGLNLRWARAVPGQGERLLGLIARLKHSEIRSPSLLILSPPRCGKTTLIRDLARVLGDSGVRTVVVDERSEIAGFGGTGVPGHDVGQHTDILDGWTKPEGMMAALRTLSPELLVVDELGGEADVAGVRLARHSGVDVIATVHASGPTDLKGHGDLQTMVEEGLFDAVVLLSRRHGPGTIEQIWPGKEGVG